MDDLLGFLASSSPGEWVPVLIPIVAVIFVFSIPITALITEYFQKRNRVRLMEKAIEHGVPAETLKLEDEPRRRLPYRSGMVTAAAGIGCMLFGLFLAIGLDRMNEPDAPMVRVVFVAIGLFILMIGLALLINDKLNYNRIFRNGNGENKR